MKNAIFDTSGRFMAAVRSDIDLTGTSYIEVDDAVAESLTSFHRLVDGSWVVEDPRTLQDFKDAQWALIKQSRSQAEYAGFTWDGSTFDSDATSQNRITGAVTLAVLSPSFTIDWILADNSTRLLNQADMMQVGAALGLHVAAQFAKGVTLRTQIEAATTQAEIEAVVW